ncbi:ankyrin repeat-containing protein, putative [Ricinus communis]|uniref:Ankyrin repeat-containing protein, putative n=1 Tax=Ricinus communis TaxID=3988 RepID=B9RK37_RICCO|nr:ankyrin repeat-containing protein, putative [Ricinus communis]
MEMERKLQDAAMEGHQKPEFASEMDPNGCSPLLLAAAKGKLELAKELLGSGPSNWYVEKSRWEDASSFSSPLRAVLNLRNRVASLCGWGVNGLEALNILIEVIRKDEELINWKDHGGNTLIHVAVAKKQIQIIKSLLSIIRLELNALDSNGLTALDILVHSPRELRDMEIQEFLIKARASSAKGLHIIEKEWTLTRDITESNLSSHQNE